MNGLDERGMERERDERERGMNDLDERGMEREREREMIWRERKRDEWY